MTLRTFSPVKSRFRTLLLSATAIALTGMIPLSSSGEIHAASKNERGLHFLGRWVSGSGLAGAEITAFDPATARMFVTNGATNMIDVVDISNPSSPVKYSTIDLASLGAKGVQSVATKNGVVAIAASMATNQVPGRIFLTDTDGKLLESVPNGIEVGALPDSVHFSPNGQFVVSANEGEPSSYCLTNGTLPTSTDPYGTISIIDVTEATPTATTINFESFNERAGAIAFEGGRIFGPNATVAQDLEPEYVAITADSKYAYVTLQENNAIATVDLEAKTLVNVMPLGYKDHSTGATGLDADNKDLAGVIANKPVMGMYLPDALATTKVGGVQYIITANEGDSRSYPCVLGGTSTTTVQDEDAAFSKIAASTVSSTVTAATGIGNLKTTPFAPAGVSGSPVSSTTKVTSAYSFGTRSFSVWKANDAEGIFKADRVYDSGDSIEQFLLKTRPAQFNADWDTTTGLIKPVDSRSNAKGPEPEGIAIGSAYGKKWMALALERDSGVLLYDVTDPLNPEMVDYENTSVITGNILTSKTNGAAGDVSPEGVTFVSPLESPTGAALFIVSYELSGTVAIFEIPPRVPGPVSNVKVTVGAKSVKVSYTKSKIVGWGGQPQFKVRCGSVTGTVYNAYTFKTTHTFKVPSTVNRSYRCGVTVLSQQGKTKTVLARVAYGAKG